MTKERCDGKSKEEELMINIARVSLPFPFFKSTTYGQSEKNDMFMFLNSINKVESHFAQGFFLVSKT